MTMHASKYVMRHYTRAAEDKPMITTENGEVKNWKINTNVLSKYHGIHYLLPIGWYLYYLNMVGPRKGQH